MRFRDNHIADFIIQPRTLWISFLAIIVGAVGAVIALLLTKLIGFFTNLFFYQRLSFEFVPAYPNHLGAVVIFVPVIGGLMIGLMARFGSDKIRGHGIPEAMESILIGKSIVQPKVAFLKPISAAISIGSGGPFGAEGPIIMTGSAFGSIFAQFFHVTASERKILLLSGAAAGMCATFNAPLASILFVIELLAFEMRLRCVVPVSLASGIAAFIRISFFGTGPMFPSLAKPLSNGKELLIAMAFGVIGAILAYILTKMIYGVEDLFEKLPFHWMWFPAIGAIAIGIGGYFVPQALGVGYDSIRNLVTGHFVLTTAISFLLVKTFIWVIALGSGTSGGILAPLLIIGGTSGDILASVFHANDPAVWAILGMAATFGGVTRSPFTTVVFIFELTHNIEMLLPSIITCAVAAGISAIILPRSILTEKIARRGRHINRDYMVDPIEMQSVSTIMIPVGKMGNQSSDMPSVHASITTRQAVELMMENRCKTLKVINKNSKQIIGFITLESLFQGRNQHIEEEYKIERIINLKRKNNRTVENKDVETT
jgi:H+/Cl- antiporter ClcA